MARRTWLRLYDDALLDDRLIRISKNTGDARLAVLGAWVALLILAHESPRPGALLRQDGSPLLLEDFARIFNVNKDHAERLLCAFHAENMVGRKHGAASILSWDDDQPPSDSSADRVARWRERHGETNTETDENLERFLQEYPVKQKQAACRRIWRQKGLSAIAEKILQNVKARKRHDERWKDGFVLDPDKYLSNELYEDPPYRLTEPKAPESLEEQIQKLALYYRTVSHSVEPEDDFFFQCALKGVPPERAKEIWGSTPTASRE